MEISLKNSEEKGRKIPGFYVVILLALVGAAYSTIGERETVCISSSIMFLTITHALGVDLIGQKS